MLTYQMEAILGFSSACEVTLRFWLFNKRHCSRTISALNLLVNCIFHNYIKICQVCLNFELLYHTMIQFSFLCRDVSYNNLSGPMPKLSARTFRIIVNPLLCGQNSVNNCSYIYPEPLVLQVIPCSSFSVHTTIIACKDY
ncbi:putative non-specific serine/threonine protein kinase [Helianthus annuus]|nr:putative non-specific serine/threonine protein kinase [Helianthus annuus]KAJ0680230.1 putative non-specific serine/threonine protein kinase [Helianthus annuus]